MRLGGNFIPLGVCWSVAAGDFSSIEVGDVAIIVAHAEGEGFVFPGGMSLEAVSEVDGGVFREHGFEDICLDERSEGSWPRFVANGETIPFDESCGLGESGVRPDVVQGSITGDEPLDVCFCEKVLDRDALPDAEEAASFGNGEGLRCGRASRWDGAREVAPGRSIW